MNLEQFDYCPWCRFFNINHSLLKNFFTAFGANVKKTFTSYNNCIILYKPTTACGMKKGKIEWGGI